MIKRNTRIYYASQLLHSLIFTIPIWIVFYQGRISVLEISFIVAFQYAVQVILELPSGALADLIGRRKTVLLGFIFGAIGYLIIPFCHELWHFIIMSILVGTADSFRSGSEEALLYDTFVEGKQTDNYDHVYANGNVIYQGGLIFATFFGGIIYGLNTNLPFILYGASLLLGATIIFLYIEPAIDSAKFTLTNYIQQIITGTQEAFKDNYTKYLSLFYVFVGGIAWTSTLYFNEYMLIDLGFSDSARGMLTAIMRFINIAVITIVLKNKQIFNTKRSILFFPIVMVISYLPGVFLDGFFGLPFIQGAMIVTTARWIILSPMTNAAFSSKYRATAISSLSLFIGIVYILLTGLSGIVIDTLGIKAMYTLLGVIAAITVIPLTHKLLQYQSKRIIQSTSA